MGKTLNEYIDKLKPKQQEYIVSCIRTDTSRKDFHRGLLPFLEAKEAYKCVKARLDKLMIVPGDNPVDENDVVINRIRFIRETLSVFAGAIPFETDFDERDSTKMLLSNLDLSKQFGRELGTHFSFNSKVLSQETCCTVELSYVSRNVWQVTCSKKFFGTVTLLMADRFRRHLNVSTRRR